MSDLISREVLLEALEDYGFNQETMIPTISLMKVLEIIEEQPAAYDVDKVVEELKKEFKKYYGGNWDKAPYLVKAIEIVKGAVKDE